MTEIGREYIPGPPRTKIGNSEIKISKEMLQAIRAKFRTYLPETRLASIKLDVYKDYPGWSESTIEKYVGAARVHDDVFALYLADKISFGVMEDVSPLHPDTGKYLIEEMLEKKLLPIHIQKAKSLMKQKVVHSWDDALKMASNKTGTDPIPPGLRRNGTAKGARSFDELMKDIIFSGTEWRLKVKAVIAMLPMVADGATSSFSTFTKLYMLRDTLKEQFDFVDKTVRSVLDRMEKKASLEAEMEERSHGETRDGSTPAARSGDEGREEAGESGVHGDRQAVPHASRQGEGA
jgi:hypothetical protein